jgi:hypothetical protein
VTVQVPYDHPGEGPRHIRLRITAP